MPSKVTLSTLFLIVYACFFVIFHMWMLWRFGRASLEVAYPFFIRWGYDKFPKETPLVFYRAGRPILPALEMMDGLQLVLKLMASYIQNEIPGKTLKFWRLQSPRHFYGGEWNQNGSCLFNEPLEESQVRATFALHFPLSTFLFHKVI